MNDYTHEKWCNARPPHDGACDCRDVHPSNAIPREPSATEVLQRYYQPGRVRPPRVVHYLKDHPV